jgi:hypothetical protein
LWGISQSAGAQVADFTVDKIAVESAYDGVGDVIHYQITITNTGISPAL